MVGYYLEIDYSTFIFLFLLVMHLMNRFQYDGYLQLLVIINDETDLESFVSKGEDEYFRIEILS